MKNPRFIFRLFFLLCLAPVAAGVSSVAGDTESGELPDGLYARFEITFTRDDEPESGEFICRLFFEDAPMTVANFVTLAEGTRRWLDPETAKITSDRFYDGLIFHRVIEDFVIQTGSRRGDGTDGPGYTFGDEIRPDLNHASAGILSMANAGPHTNGSQFFITLEATPELDGLHTVFGEVVEGMETVEAIGAAPTGKDLHDDEEEEENGDTENGDTENGDTENGGENGTGESNGENGNANGANGEDEDENGEESPMIPDDRPINDIVIERITIIRNGPEAEAFDANELPLPDVRGIETRMIAEPREGRAEPDIILGFEQSLFEDYPIHFSNDLEEWNSLGFLRVTTFPESEFNLTREANLSIAANPRLFFRVARVIYPADVAFLQLHDKTFDLVITSFDPDQTLTLSIDSSGSSGSYILNEGKDQVITGSILSASEGNPYSLDLEVQYDLLAPMRLNFVFEDNVSGTFSGTAFANPQVNLSGIFTVSGGD